MNKILSDYLPPDVVGMFTQMDIAEQEIERGKQMYPGASSAIHASFTHMCPTDILRFVNSDKLYRLHVREIVDRVAHGLSPQGATDAEVIGLLYMLSLNSPLKPHAVGLYIRLMHKHFKLGDKEELNNYESLYAGRMDEMYADAVIALTRGKVQDMQHIETSLLDNNLSHDERMARIERASESELLRELFK